MNLFSNHYEKWFTEDPHVVVICAIRVSSRVYCFSPLHRERIFYKIVIFFFFYIFRWNYTNTIYSADDTNNPTNDVVIFSNFFFFLFLQNCSASLFSRKAVVRRCFLFVSVTFCRIRVEYKTRRNLPKRLLTRNATRIRVRTSCLVLYLRLICSLRSLCCFRSC